MGHRSGASLATAELREEACVSSSQREAQRGTSLLFDLPYPSEKLQGAPLKASPSYIARPMGSVSDDDVDDGKGDTLFQHTRTQSKFPRSMKPPTMSKVSVPFIPVPIEHDIIASPEAMIEGYTLGFNQPYEDGPWYKVYVTLGPRAQTLQWYQSRDQEIILYEHAYRYLQSISGKNGHISVLQGKVLNYEMGFVLFCCWGALN